MTHFLEFFVYSGDQPSVWCGVGGNLFPLCRLSFCLVDHVLCFTEGFQFQRIPFIVSLSICATGILFRKWSHVPLCSSVLPTSSFVRSLVKLSLFANDMLVYKSNIKNSSKELLQLTNTFSNIAGYKIKSSALLYTDNKWAEKKKSENHHPSQ